MTMIVENFRIAREASLGKAFSLRRWFAAPTGLAILGAALGFSAPEAANAQDARSAKTVLAEAKGWTYQLQGLDPGRASRVASDLLVIDYSRDGSAATAPSVEEAREGRPALQHVVHGLGEVVAARELWALGPHMSFQLADEWPAQLLADGTALVGGLAVDAALDLEQGIDAPHDLQRQRRDRSGRSAFSSAAGAGLDIGECKERPARMGPASSLQDRARRSASLVQPVVAGVGVGLQDALPS